MLQQADKHETPAHEYIRFVALKRILTLHAFLRSKCFNKLTSMNQIHDWMHDFRSQTRSNTHCTHFYEEAVSTNHEL